MELDTLPNNPKQDYEQEIHQVIIISDSIGI